MAIKSLNEAYDKNSILYLCNACGDVFNPDYPGGLQTVPALDVMNPEELNLYECYWSEDGGAWRYVLRVDGKAAMGIGYLFDRTWCRNQLEIHRGMSYALDDIALDMELEEWMPKVLEALRKAAGEVFEPLAPGCDFYIGDSTDPDGHELLVVIPYKQRTQIEEINDRLNSVVFDTIEKVFLRR